MAFGLPPMCKYEAWMKNLRCQDLRCPPEKERKTKGWTSKCIPLLLGRTRVPLVPNPPGSRLDSALQKGHSEMVNMPGVLVGRMQPSWLGGSRLEISWVLGGFDVRSHNIKDYQL